MKYAIAVILRALLSLCILANVSDKDCFRFINRELAKILRIESKSSGMPRRIVVWNRKKTCRQFDMIFGNMPPHILASSDTIIIVRNSQEYLYLGEDKAFYAVKCLPNQQYYHFTIFNPPQKEPVLQRDSTNVVQRFDKSCYLINLAIKGSPELFNKDNYRTTFADDLYIYSICMVIKRDGLFHLNYYKTLGQQPFIQDWNQ